jgi:hypothetical protein
MVNKKGWIRMLEATIAVLIVSSVLVVVYLQHPSYKTRHDDITSFQKKIMMDIGSNFTLRGYVIESPPNLPKLQEYIDSKISTNLNYSIKICPMIPTTIICKLDYIEKERFVEELIISSQINQYDPKKVVFGVWRKD